jgi:hypothetical protein
MNRFLLPVLAAVLLLPCAPHPAWAQQAAAAAPDQLQPALVSLTQAIRQLRIDKWKAPGPVKDDAARNVDSIERDLNGTLPGLIDAAQSAPSIQASFAVYRNLDALYDVALRVSLTAELAAPDVEVEALDHALGRLEEARKELGDQIAASATRQQQSLAELQAAAARPVAAPTPPPAASTVVQDGPQTKSAAKPARKKKAAAATQP